MEKISKFNIKNRIIIFFLKGINKTSPPGQPSRGIAFSATGPIIPNYVPCEKDCNLLFLGNSEK